ncbi:hypothetical protein PS834_05615 [Pseudomonas fluorescens]|nr:hypothetical protein PS834_05615 [Pseudomonas fluorescens]
MTLRGGLQRANIGLFIADIGHGDHGLAAHGLEFFLPALQWLNASPAQHHRGALFGESQGGGFADAGAGAGDEGNFSL